MDEIAIIGGGASGLAAAVEAASLLRKSHQNASVVVYEATDKVGRSILRSGNGRCNYTNAYIDKPDSRPFDNSHAQLTYHNETFVNAALQALESSRAETTTAPATVPTSAAATTSTAKRENAVQTFFDELGLMYREERDGRRFPLSGKASTILNLLRDTCKKLGVRIECDVKIDKLVPRNLEDPVKASFALHVHDGRILHARRVILSTGGNTAATLLAGIPEITTTPTHPVLAPLALRETKLTRRMDNIRVKCSVSLLRDTQQIAREKGEVLFRKYGISGIAVFNLSRDAQPEDTLRVSIIDWLDNADLLERLKQSSKTCEELTGAPSTCADVMRGIVQDPVADVIATKAHIDLNAPATKKALTKLAATLQALDFTVDGVGDASRAQVHRGGVAVSNMNAQTMQAQNVPGLYITGEALDVDGPCGGYNLHWAWASGLLAGQNITH